MADTTKETSGAKLYRKIIKIMTINFFTLPSLNDNFERIKEKMCALTALTK